MDTQNTTNKLNNSLLRFITCGSVDDGKSTLIGRILYDSKSLYDDKISGLESESKKYGTTGKDNLDLALLVDGLQSEREQGITIDVAYLFFNSTKRKYIIADTPGHEQYTRNMATGASTADVAIILVDARKGVLTQTKRHTFIAKLLGVKHLIVAINKMDIVDFSQEVFENIKKDFHTQIETKLDLHDVIFVPISALNGDNVVDKSTNTPWYFQDCLLDILDSVELSSDFDTRFRFPVQYVNRPNLDFRGFSGTICGGNIQKGDDIVILPSGKTTKVKDVILPQIKDSKQIVENKGVFTNTAITLTTTEEVDISRGDMITKSQNLPHIDDSFKANIIWMGEKPLQINKSYTFKIGMQQISGKITDIAYKIDVNSYEKMDSSELGLNDIGLCNIEFDKKIVFDFYKENKFTGSFIVIDKITNNTMGSGMVEELSQKQKKETNEFSAFEIELNALVRKHFPHWESKIIN